jgi:hypothetical protein
MTKSSPSFIEEPVRVQRSHRWRWAALAGFLALALLVQIIIADRERLATDPAWRPRLEMLCAALQCNLPPWREPKAFHVTARDIRPHPSVPNALLLTASFRNDAAFAQAWPQLEVALTDLEDQALGLRRFQAQEYLGNAPSSPLIMPGQSASLTLEIMDPGKHAVAFRLEFN